jgi:hypothetical protein
VAESSGRLVGRHVIITGASSGIGRSAAFPVAVRRGNVLPTFFAIFIQIPSLPV